MSILADETAAGNDGLPPFLAPIEEQIVNEASRTVASDLRSREVAQTKSPTTSLVGSLAYATKRVGSLALSSEEV